jgi:formylglycine-generating enzyme required for sulfatase activity
MPSFAMTYSLSWRLWGWGYPPVRCRVAFRSYDSPDYVYGTHGFRLAMTAQ